MIEFSLIAELLVVCCCLCRGVYEAVARIPSLWNPVLHHVHEVLAVAHTHTGIDTVRKSAEHRIGESA